MNRIDLYLQQNVGERYINTAEEQTLVNKFTALYSMARAARDQNELVSPKNISKWRKAYLGTLNAIDMTTGEESERKSRQLRKLCFETVESKIDNNIPLPRMKPRYKADLPLVEITEDYLKYETDVTFTKFMNDASERATYIDGTVWYKVWWDSLDTRHGRSGMPKVEMCLVDQIVPQPGVRDYRNLEYIFETEQVSLARIYDLYNRVISPQGSGTSKDAKETEQTDLSTITMTTCYYLNNDRIVGRFSWASHSQQVICHEEDWQIRKLRTCVLCKEVVPQEQICPNCGSKNFKYEIPQTEILEKDLNMIVNPYEIGETEEQTPYESRLFLSEGTEIPFYRIRRLPFVPRPAISSIDGLYGIGEVFILLDMQDSINKVLTKAQEKTLKSGAVMTVPETIRVNDTDETFKIVKVRTAEQAAMIVTKQVIADTQYDIMFANMTYDSAKSSSGITDSFQGKRDPTATSGIAKEFSALQTAGRIESLRVAKAAAYAGIYELVLMYLLAFSDEKRKFLKVLPDGEVEEQAWSKYMFLDKDEYGTIFYRDDFEFSSDPASTLSQNRVAMWQETQNNFIQGGFGNPAEPNTLELFWNIMEQQQYPLAKLALAGIKDNRESLPPEIEQLLVQNPQLVQMALQMAQEQGLIDSGHGGAREGAGAPSNGATQAVNVERTNERNRVAAQEAQVPVQGGVTGGTIG